MKTIFIIVLVLTVLAMLWSLFVGALKFAALLAVAAVAIAGLKSFMRNVEKKRSE